MNVRLPLAQLEFAAELCEVLRIDRACKGTGILLHRADLTDLQTDPVPYEAPSTCGQNPAVQSSMGQL